MAYSIIATNEMNMLLDNCVDYLLNKLNNQQAAEHLLAEVAEVYEQLEDNPYIYRMSQDSFMKSLNYHEAKIKGMDYVIIYKVVERNIYIRNFPYIGKLCATYGNSMEFV